LYSNAIESGQLMDNIVFKFLNSEQENGCHGWAAAAWGSSQFVVCVHRSSVFTIGRADAAAGLAGLLSGA
jgi:hypothetical protein